MLSSSVSETSSLYWNADEGQSNPAALCKLLSSMYFNCSTNSLRQDMQCFTVISTTLLPYSKCINATLAAVILYISSQLPKPDKCRRLTVTSAGISEGSQYFVSRLHEYLNTMLADNDKDKIAQLIECCNEPLRKDVSRFHGTLTGKSFQEALAAIWQLAIRDENVLVARVMLNSMHQDHDEPICNYRVLIRGQATVCKYTIKCSGCQANVS